MLFIIRMEGKFVEKLPFKILIYACIIVLIIGVLLKITHWQFGFISGSLLIPVTAAMLLVSLVLAAIIEQNKNLLHYLLFLFIGFILFLVEYPFEILTWWIYLVLVIFLGLISLLSAIKA
ncbi:hypothetical protein Y10_03020 [Neptunitalea sp. Y10]|uniref:Uncharacterized protein n=2 Tax=Neptunitalea lumnitzerae TaxID=2965509 RepID=A0ABQ5MEX4_9FLAO|nr:hypothetical protein Y10_03020 [Neptunitalea sp. Y10]